MLKERPLSRIRVLGLFLALALAAFAALATPASAKSGSLTTLFDFNNGFAGNTFDLEVRHSSGVVVESLDVNLNNAGATPTIEVWTRPGSAAGFETTLDGWTSRGSTVVTSAGFDTPTPTPISFSLPAGSYGVAVGVTDYPSVTMEYTNGSQTFENSVLKLISGGGLGSPPLDSTLTPNRIWNGTIHYSTPSEECADLKAKQKKAKKKYKKAKKKAKKAKASGSQSKYKKAQKKAKKRKKKFKKAKKAYRKACK